ncbi:lytic transglycosylase [Opitutaceae bacterium EW11]|nr:lytic transglycosylase [Opitutaceae bacterium EW11]
MKHLLPLAICSALLAAPPVFATTDSAGAPGSAKRDAPAPQNTAKPEDAAAPQVDTQQLYEIGKQLFDEYAPDDVKEEYEFPSQQQWDAFANRLQTALQGGSLEELASFEPEARRALAAFRVLPGYSDYVDWLSERLDLIETARAAVEAQKKPKPPVATTPAVPATPTTPEPETHPSEPTAPAAPLVPYYDVWLDRLRNRPPPPRADELLPLLKVIFSAEGLPPELAWLAEVESSLNPSARSPAGARGLFQLMPATAKSMGLSLFPFDERSHPGKNARAAARLLRKLHDRFDSWPLALAAYNAGEGRIATALKKSQASSFAAIADSLPSETRMYVPKVFATLTVRENIEPRALAEPTAAAATAPRKAERPVLGAISSN